MYSFPRSLSSYISDSSGQARAFRPVSPEVRQCASCVIADKHERRSSSAAGWIVSLRCEVCNLYQSPKMVGLKYITSDGQTLDERFVLDRFHYRQGPPLREASLYRCFVCDKILSHKDSFFSSEHAQTKLSEHVKEHSYAELVSSSRYAPRPKTSTQIRALGTFSRACFKVGFLGIVWVYLVQLL